MRGRPAPGWSPWPGRSAWSGGSAGRNGTAGQNGSARSDRSAGRNGSAQPDPVAGSTSDGVVDGRRDTRPVLYAIACGSPAAGYVGEFVTLAQRAGWQVAVVVTPDGRKFVDTAALARQTGHPVRSEYKQPDEPDRLPAADAMVVAPATVNTINKWANGIADTLALGLLIEAYGLGLPVVAMPFTNRAMAAHPTFQASLRTLRSWGVQVIFGEHPMPAPGTGKDHAASFPWRLPLAALGPPRHARPTGRPGHPDPKAPAAPLTLSPIAPPMAPRPGPAILSRPLPYRPSTRHV